MTDKLLLLRHTLLHLRKRLSHAAALSFRGTAKGFYLGLKGRRILRLNHTKQLLLLLPGTAPSQRLVDNVLLTGRVLLLAVVVVRN